MTLSKIRIVLVEPAGPLNVGSVARAMKNMGLQQLVLVNPHCDPLGAEALPMAVHAKDVLVNARRVATVPEALVGCDRAIATTARTRSLQSPLEAPQVALPWLLQTPADEKTAAALLFGPEDRGLSNTELNYAQRFVCIPTSPTYPSLNLAQAVTICCYLLYQLAETQFLSSASPMHMPPSNPKSSQWDRQHSEPAAPVDVLEGYYQHLETLLLKIGYLYPHTAASRMEKFRHLFNRARLSQEEVSMLRGILRQVAWALNPK